MAEQRSRMRPQLQGDIAESATPPEDPAVNEMRLTLVNTYEHHLKTPLTVIEGYATFLQDRSDIPPDLSRIIQSMGKAAEQASQILSQIRAVNDLSQAIIIDHRHPENGKYIHDLAEATKPTRSSK